MCENAKPSTDVMDYFRVLRAEIVEAQKLRVQVGLTKVVFLGTLLGFFLKEAKGDPAILICPFVALMFDCLVYGLSFNIRDIGRYIRDHIEQEMLQNPATAGVALWQTYRTEREESGFRDWGRIIFRIGSYGLSILVAVVSFFQVVHSRTAGTVQSVPGLWLISLILLLVLGWGILIWLEFLRRSERQSSSRPTSPTGATSL